MYLRKLRWLTTGIMVVVAALMSPGRSAADIQVVIQEASGEGPVTLFSGTVASNGQINTSSSNYSTINVEFGNSPASLGSGSLSASFSTSYTLTPSSSGVAPNIYISANDLGLTGTGLAGIPDPTTTYKNQVSNTSSTASSTGVTISLTDLSSSNVLQSDSYNVDSNTGFASQSQVISSPANAYSILQNFTIIVNGSPIGQTLTGGATTILNPIQASPVPAPGGLVLAAFALPVFGLRRMLRRKVA